MAKGKNVNRSSSGSGSGSVNSRDVNRSQAANRIQKKSQGSGGGGAGPSSILGVYDYVVNNNSNSQDNEGGSSSSKKRKRSDRASRRIIAGTAESDPTSAQNNNKRRRRHDDSDGEDDDDEDDDDEDISDSERVKAPAIFSDGEAEFEGEDEDIDSDEAFGESDEERYDGWALSGSKSKKEEDDFENDEDAVGLDQMLNAVSDEEEDADMEDDEEDIGVKGLDDFITPTNPGPADFHNFDEAPSASASAAAGPLTLEDLLAPLDQDASLGAAELRKRVSALSAEMRGKTKSSSREGASAIDSKTGALAAPLPSILQDRVDRSAAYDVTKAQVEGWQPTIKRLREAEHLSFPLQKPQQTKSSNASLVASMLSTKAGSATRSALETQTGDLLRAAGMTDAQLSKQESLVMNKLDPALVEERRKELMRMRELMFRAEQKARRQNKIKSKSYRRIARKEKEKLKQKMAEAGISMDDVLGDEDDEVDYEAQGNKERLRAERERAKERATLKHKNTGQWAKTMSGRRERNEETTAALEDQIRRGQELRKKIEDDDDEDDEDSDSEEEDDSDDEEEEGDGFGGPAQVNGRQTFGSESRFKAAEREAIAAAQKKASEADTQAAAVAKTAAAKRADKAMSKSKAARSAAALDDARVEIDDGSDLTGLVPSSSSSHTAAVATSSGRKHGKAPEELDAGSDTDLSDEDGSGALAVPSSKASKNGKVKAAGSIASGSGKGKNQNNSIAFSQRDLVAEAFAGDDVAAQFAEEKQALIDADAPKEEDNSLPGWGSWSGKGVKHTPSQKARILANKRLHTRHIPGILASQRKDSGLSNVVINERADKKLDKYKVKDLPHPYTSSAQYEMVMKGAMGAEWNTRTQHQRMTLPKVVTKPGKAIQPIERKF